MMSRKIYERTAKIIRDLPDATNAQKAYLTVFLGDMFAADNPKFKRDTFENAVRYAANPQHKTEQLNGIPS